MATIEIILPSPEFILRLKKRKKTYWHFLQCVLAAGFPDWGQNKTLSCDPTLGSKLLSLSALDGAQVHAYMRYPPSDKSDTYT